MPYSAAANATAWAWFPAEMAITPRFFSSSVRLAILFRAPRGLNEPVRWKSSHFKRAPRVRLVSSGVRLRWRSTISRARTTSSRSTTLAHRLEEDDRGRGGGIEAVDRARRDGDGDPGARGVQPGIGKARVFGPDDDGGRLRQ